ncbi:cell envelope biogenesis protein OmpA [Arenibacter sp. TNZ]|jgi:outer membrane protein OmpA-like peptidoglycan-associated protein|uniref:OmpA family protein n=1 Tax=Arenibacter TaxID=178469 RepID=UPI000CD48B05|nr:MULTISPECIES: OmpA family protein [Arenibacter]MCM4173785.1 cell envelope biogenesis protein OmpA [Arenibacter sp. TNZ]
MRFKVVVIFFIILSSFGFAQQKKTKGDILFFEYSYGQAIKEYQKELREGVLSNKQYLNLADAYLYIGNYKEASEIYVNIYQKDTTMSTHHFNKMLQSLSKTSEIEKVRAYLATKKDGLSGELLENADFNYELIASNTNQELDFKIFNVSGNSPQADFSPTFYKDKLLFSSSRPDGSKKVYGPSGDSYLNIFESNIEPQGDIKSPQEFKNISDSNFHRSTPYYSEELGYVFYVLSNSDGENLQFSENGKNALSIGMSNGQGSFKFILRDPDTSFYYPFYEAATGKLFFAANFDDSLGGTDIYYVYTNDGLIMSSPINLGPRINTPGNEIAPFIFENSLYFSSDIFYGLGGMDIYRSNIHADDSFSIPINLGEGINSPKDDFGFIIKNNDSNGLLGYFSSNRDGGKGKDDIYGFNVKEKPGLKTLSLKGKILTPNKNGVHKAMVNILDAEGKSIKEVYTKESGDYEIEIPWRDEIVLQVSKERYSMYKKAYSKDELEDLNTDSFNVDLAFIDDIVEESEDQSVIKMNKFYFSKGASEITPLITPELDKVVNAVKLFPQMQLRIESHTDSRGGSSSNFNLSQKRADAIKKYLLKQGVPNGNILYSIGYGEDKLLNGCKDGVFCLEMLHNKNERSLIVVLNYKLMF